MSVEVSDISSGKLTKTTVFKSPVSISSSTIMLSPDETMLYVVNTQGATVSALFFDKTTGTITPGCTSPKISRAVAKLVISGWTQSYQSNRKWRRSLRC